jgi:RhoGAP domain
MEDIEDKTARVRRLSELVRALPKVNYELLRIISKHLKRIVAHAQENKMTIRNGGPRSFLIANNSRYCLFSYPEYPGAGFFTFHHGIRICFR